MMLQSIYIIQNNQNDKFYVGRSNNVKERFRKHKKMLANGCHDNIYLQRAWDKYDGDFTFKVIHNIDTGDIEKDRLLAIEKEQEVIDANTIGVTIYNLSKSASTGVTCGEQHRYYGLTPREWMGEESYAISQKKKSEKAKGENNPFYGRHHTEETKEILRSKCRNFGEKNGFYGKTHTEETLDKLRKNAKNAKRIMFEGNEYPSINQAVRETGHTKARIKYRLKSENYIDCYYL